MFVRRDGQTSVATGPNALLKRAELLGLRGSDPDYDAPNCQNRYRRPLRLAGSLSALTMPPLAGASASAVVMVWPCLS